MKNKEIHIELRTKMISIQNEFTLLREKLIKDYEGVLFFKRGFYKIDSGLVSREPTKVEIVDYNFSVNQYDKNELTGHISYYVKGCYDGAKIERFESDKFESYNPVEVVV